MLAILSHLPSAHLDEFSIAVRGLIEQLLIWLKCFSIQLRLVLLFCPLVQTNSETRVTIHANSDQAMCDPLTSRQCGGARNSCSRLTKPSVSRTELEQSISDGDGREQQWIEDEYRQPRTRYFPSRQTGHREDRSTRLKLWPRKLSACPTQQKLFKSV